MTHLSKIRGVNLGGWLVLEKWMTPSLFAGLEAVDETSFCRELGDRTESVLRKHWESFITDEDFRWIKAIGLNSVRIPVGHWIFGDRPPYAGAIDVLDWAMETAAAHDLSVLLDLHAAPGCQNGFDNGGIAGVMEWHLHRENVDQSVQFIERISERYKDSSHLLGVELLNEPHWDVPIDILKDYYTRAYAAVRKHLPAERAAVVFHDGFRPLAWEGFLQPPEYTNVILDTHVYQCFTQEDADLNAYGHIQKASVERAGYMDQILKQLPTIVGEWSLGIDRQSLQGLNGFQTDAAFRAYGAAQLMSFERGSGWYFWSYKLENGIMPQWNFRECVSRGWLPAGYHD